MIIGRYIGIDPGKSGGISAIDQYDENDERGTIEVQYMPMPDTETNIYRCIKMLAFRHINARAVIERVHAYPKQGIASAFVFGQGYGFLRACLIATGCPFVEVSPRAWQAAVGVCQTKRSKNSTADAARDKKNHKLKLLGQAQQRFPDLRVWQQSKTTQLAVCDSILLAEYCRLNNR